MGTGNDFYGWEFHKHTKIAYGTIVTDEMRWENPAPTRMFWRPDKMVVEYELTSPYIQGIYRIGSIKALGFYFSKWVFGWGSIDICPAWGCNQDGALLIRSYFGCIYFLRLGREQ